VSAIVAYVVFYYNYIPQIGVERVVHMQFGYATLLGLHNILVYERHG
jgi:hypothetical protein